MKSFEEMLKTHGGRDVLIRTLGYACLLSSGLTKGSLSRKFRIASSEFSHCRVVCRLLDDWPMLQYSLSYGTGKHENDSTLQMLGVLKNIADQVFYPIEHISWLCNKKNNLSRWQPLGDCRHSAVGHLPLLWYCKITSDH
uniref:Peroxin-11C n=1 Tax=Rhipicephalus zambeziensis TaxID=60191 RepID=A0A224YVJ3_9ACAR